MDLPQLAKVWQQSYFFQWGYHFHIYIVTFIASSSLRGKLKHYVEEFSILKSFFVPIHPSTRSGLSRLIGSLWCLITLSAIQMVQLRVIPSSTWVCLIGCFSSYIGIQSVFFFFFNFLWWNFCNYFGYRGCSCSQLEEPWDWMWLQLSNSSIQEIFSLMAAPLSLGKWFFFFVFVKI